MQELILSLNSFFFLTEAIASILNIAWLYPEWNWLTESEIASAWMLILFSEDSSATLQHCRTRLVSLSQIFHLYRSSKFYCLAVFTSRWVLAHFTPGKCCLSSFVRQTFGIWLLTEAPEFRISGKLQSTLFLLQAFVCVLYIYMGIYRETYPFCCQIENVNCNLKYMHETLKKKKLWDW